ncbi:MULTISPECIES: VWA domain-containing protein [unclassified Myxococcus]|uniref:VWA domain-containing protein n=1 Tax=unclassified Myxococcus TaxID=2648731 RepID=UPI00157A2DE1|nr:MULTISPECIES: VWA domain-containing protein [unclassified Myxococcus]NTX04437.1 VWA domain-containing protein [Myxococcus sp. CA040A]NTX36603.1 VWA domain-containing protein [Myxococcus sp. CA033]NTX57547.1 VWA domain-containing protein [Myxococcus sp. CA039A]
MFARILNRWAPRALAGAALSLALLSGTAAHAFTEEHVIILIDRSGTMRTTRASGQTRFADALVRGRDFVQTPNALPRLFAIWTFEGGGYRREQGFEDGPTTVASLSRLSVGAGATPLALAVCDAADELLQFGPGIDARKVVRLISDGEENSTPEATLCYGPPSATRYPDLEEGSWEWKVRNMLKTGDPLRDSPNPFQLVFDADVFFNHITLAPEPFFLTFVQEVAKASGGRYTPIDDVRPLPIPGDTDGNGCVDSVDYRFMLANYGLRVPPASPAADFNGDRVVDFTDYSIVLGNLGRGCNSVLPPVLPVHEVRE